MSTGLRPRWGVLSGFAVGVVALGLAAWLPSWGVVASPGGGTTRVSVASTGESANGHSGEPAITAHGRYVVYSSAASNLAPDDSNGKSDVFFWDRKLGTTMLISLSSTGRQGNADSTQPAVSAMFGRYVVFSSAASNLVPGDTNGARDVFVRARRTGVTQRVSVSSSGQQGNGESSEPTISRFGHYVVFTSSASNLVPGDTNGARDVFIRDLSAGVTQRVSVAGNGEQGNDSSSTGASAKGGRYVVFTSSASNLVPGDTNGTADVFIRDREQGTTGAISRSSTGQLGNNRSMLPVINRGGRFVAFYSDASNLVPEDTTTMGDMFVLDRRLGIMKWVALPDYPDCCVYRSTGTGDLSYGGRLLVVSWSDYVPVMPLGSTCHVMVRDLKLGTSRRVVVPYGGGYANGCSWDPAISHNGSYVAFTSNASNLVSDDTNRKSDIFVREAPFGTE